METIKDNVKVTHQLPTIQYNDKAIKDLKWNKQHSKRKRIEVNIEQQILSQKKTLLLLVDYLKFQKVMKKN